MEKDVQNKLVAVIDDDKLSSHNLGVKLRFVGERYLVLPSADWRKRLEGEGCKDVYTLVIGTLNGTKPQALVEALRAVAPDLPLILTGEPALLDELDPTLREAVVGVLQRPAPYEQLMGCLNLARRRRGLAANSFDSALISKTGTAMFRSLVGQSEKIQQVRGLIEQVARRDVPVLIRGESGTGKEIVARNLHYSSGRGDGPFVAVNSAALSMETLDPAFYRSERGESPDPGAAPGYFDKARGGTLFLDLLDEMSLDVQAMLLRYLEQRRGGDAAASGEPGTRLVVAARDNLEEKVAGGQFREDLFYRLNVFPIEMPPLRERVDDIPELLSELSNRLESRSGLSVRFNSAACLSLQRHPWPGNVRELANLVERLSIIRPNEVIGLSDLPATYQHISNEEIVRMENAALGQAPVSGEAAVSGEELMPLPGLMDKLNLENLRRYLGNFEKQLIEVALEDCDWDVQSAAEHLQTSPAQLDQMMKKHGLGTGKGKSVT